MNSPNARPAPSSSPPIPADAAARWALFLDVDGTLVDIAPTPDGVIVGPRVIAVLEKLQQALGGAIALVSGRAIASLDRMFSPLVLPAGGTHGLERRGADGRIHRTAGSRGSLDTVRAGFARFAALHRGTIVEDKELSIALHFRLAPACGDEARELAQELARGAGDGFRVQHGKMIVEIRPPGGDKGSVVEAFMGEPPFAGRMPVFIGDDVTDEDGFIAANRAGGLSLRIGDDARTAAQLRLPAVPSLIAWLERLAAQPRRPD